MPEKKHLQGVSDKEQRMYEHVKESERAERDDDVHPDQEEERRDPQRAQVARAHEDAAAARSELAALQAEHHAAVNALRSNIATRASELERARTQLALSVKSIIPQARATLASTTAGYQVGRVDFASVIDAQASLFTIETSYWQALTDFAKALADLEHTVGAEVLR